MTELYPLADGIAIVSQDSPFYIAYTEVEIVLFELQGDRLPFDLRVVKRDEEKKFFRGCDIAYWEYTRLQEYLSGQGVSLRDVKRDLFESNKDD